MIKRRLVIKKDINKFCNELDGFVCSKKSDFSKNAWIIMYDDGVEDIPLEERLKANKKAK